MRQQISIGLMTILAILAVSVTLSTIPTSNALIQRNFDYLNDNHLTARYGNTVVCGDHLCEPGEWEKLQEQLTAAQLGNQARNTKISQVQGTSTPTSHGLVLGIIPQNTAVISPTLTPTLRLSNANVPVIIPLAKGLYDGKDLYYITTESSDSDMAQVLTKYNGFPVTFASSLTKSPDSVLSNIYIFKNGLSGSGILGSQSDVFDAIPTESKYSPIWKVSYVEWKDPKNATLLGSDDDISDAEAKGQVTITPTSIVVNCPIIKWSGDKEGTVQPGNMMIKDNTEISDTTPQSGGQLLNIDTEKMEATFIAHRAFAPDGSTAYYIITDASASDDANSLGVVYANKTANMASSGASSDYYVFGNGIQGTGSAGYQPGIADAKIGDQSYSPLWLIHRITWIDANQASLLLDINDIKNHGNQIKISQEGLIINAPHLSEETVFSHSK